MTPFEIAYVINYIVQELYWHLDSMKKEILPKIREGFFEYDDEIQNTKRLNLECSTAMADMMDMWEGIENFLLDNANDLE